MPDKKKRKKAQEQVLQDQNALNTDQQDGQATDNPVQDNSKEFEVEVGVKISDETSVTGASMNKTTRYEEPTILLGYTDDSFSDRGFDVTYEEVATTQQYRQSVTTVTTNTHNTNDISYLENQIKHISEGCFVNVANRNHQYKEIQKCETAIQELSKGQGHDEAIAYYNDRIQHLRELISEENSEIDEYKKLNPDLVQLLDDMDYLIQNNGITEETRTETTPLLHGVPANKDLPPEAFKTSEKVTRHIAVPLKKDYLDIESLKTIYKENDNDAGKTYQYLVDFIKENKDNQDVLQHTISSLLNAFEAHYDLGRNQTPPGNNIVDTFDKILNLKDGEQLQGFMCSSIHATMMQVLNDCGIEAVTLGGSAGTMDISTNHETLLYKNTKGEYIFCNYRNFSKINAPTIVDAIKEVHKNSGNFNTNGYISIMDKNNTYQRFELENVAAWGKAIADRELMQSPGQTPIVKNSIRANLEKDNDGQTFTTGFSVANQNNTRMTSLDVQAKKMDDSDIFDESQSIGGKFNVVSNKPLSDKTTLYSDNTAILTYTHGTKNHRYKNDVDTIKAKLNPVEITPTPDEITYGPKNTVYLKVDNGNVEKTIKETVQDITTTSYKIVENGVFENETPIDQEPQQLMQISSKLGSGQYRGKIGLETEIVNNPNLKITSVTEVGAKAELTAGNGFDGYISSDINQGVKVETKLDSDLTLNGNLSAGVTADLLSRSNYQGMFLQPGFKGTGGVDLTWQPAQHLDIGASVNGGIFTDAASTATAYSVGASASYKPGENAPTLFTNGQYTVQHEQLHLGNFNEAVRDNNSLKVQFGAKFKNNSEISADYTRYRDALHQNQNCNLWTMTIRKTF